MTLNRLLASTIIAASAFAGLGYMASEAGASPARDDSSSVTVTVDGVDYPMCAEEDCSDQPGQVGVWYSDPAGLGGGTGLNYLIIGESTYPIVP